MPTTLTPWSGLLSRRFSNVKDEYGPHSQAVASALAVLDKTQWLEHVGEPWLERSDELDGGVTVVRSWEEALTIFGAYDRYNVNGILENPASASMVFERFPERRMVAEGSRRCEALHSAVWLDPRLTASRAAGSLVRESI